jgi:hypothetical protein
MMGFVQGALVFDNNKNIFFVPNRLGVDETLLKQHLRKRS